MTALPRIADIQRAVADSYGLPVEMMRAVDRPWRFSHPRQTAMCLAYRLTNHNLTRIGHFFGGRDRKTVYHACAQVEKRCRTDPRVHDALRAITLELLRNEPDRLKRAMEGV